MSRLGLNLLNTLLLNNRHNNLSLLLKLDSSTQELIKRHFEVLVILQVHLLDLGARERATQKVIYLFQVVFIYRVQFVILRAGDGLSTSLVLCYIHCLPTSKRFQNGHASLLLTLVKESVFNARDGTHKVQRELIHALLMIKNFPQKLLTRRILNHEVLVPVQGVFSQLNAPRHTKHEHLEPLPDPVLHQREILAERPDALDHRDVQNRDARFYCQLFNRFPDGFKLRRNDALAEPALHLPVHQRPHVRHEQRERCVPERLKHGVRKVECGELYIGQDLTQI